MTIGLVHIICHTVSVVVCTRSMHDVTAYQYMAYSYHRWMSVYTCDN